MKSTLPVVPLTVLLLVSSAVAQDRMEFSDDSPTSEIPNEVPAGFIPLIALPGTEVALNLEAAYDPATGRQMVRERFETTISEGQVFAGRTLRLLFVDFERFAYSTLELQGFLEADFPRARTFVNRTPVAGFVSDDQLRARLLGIYSSRLDSMAGAFMARDTFDDSGDPPEGPAGQSQGRCSMETAYALQSRDIVRIVVAETLLPGERDGRRQLAASRVLRAAEEHPGAHSRLEHRRVHDELVRPVPSQQRSGRSRRPHSRPRRLRQLRLPLAANLQYGLSRAERVCPAPDPNQHQPRNRWSPIGHVLRALGRREPVGHCGVPIARS